MEPRIVIVIGIALARALALAVTTVDEAHCGRLTTVLAVSDVDVLALALALIAPP